MVNDVLPLDGSQAREIEEIPLDKSELRMVQQSRNMLDFSTAKVIENRDLFATSQERRRKIRSDATRASSDECFHEYGNGFRASAADAFRF